MVFACVIALGCDGKSTPADKPPEPKPLRSVDAALAVDAAPAGVATPKTKHGLIVYSSSTVVANQPMVTGPLWFVDPDGGEPVKGPVAAENGLVVGPHVIAGHGSDGDFAIDMRAPTLVAAKSEPVEFINPDDKLVWRCSGGIAQPFSICIADANGKNRKTLFSEAKKSDNDVGVVAAAGKDLVHGNYTVLSKLPAFSIRLGDGKRTDYPGLLRNAKDVSFDPFYSPNGTKAATCGKDLIITTFDGSAKPLTIKLDREPVRCTCRFSHDDGQLGCSILYEAKESGIDSLWLFDLRSNQKMMLAKELAIGSFVWSPDDTQIAYVGTAPKRWVLRVTSLDGRITRDLFNLDMETSLIDLGGWTAP